MRIIVFRCNSVQNLADAAIGLDGLEQVDRLRANAGGQKLVENAEFH